MQYKHQYHSRLHPLPILACLEKLIGLGMLLQDFILLCDISYGETHPWLPCGRPPVSGKVHHSSVYMGGWGGEVTYAANNKGLAKETWTNELCLQ